MAPSHMRMRVQSERLTMSDTAPIVQKSVRLMTTPNTALMRKVSATTV
jgi:hypothetical protein